MNDEQYKTINITEEDILKSVQKKQEVSNIKKFYLSFFLIFLVFLTLSFILDTAYSITLHKYYDFAVEDKLFPGLYSNTVLEMYHHTYAYAYLFLIVLIFSLSGRLLHSRIGSFLAGLSVSIICLLLGIHSLSQILSYKYTPQMQYIFIAYCIFIAAICIYELILYVNDEMFKLMTIFWEWDSSITNKEYAEKIHPFLNKLGIFVFIYAFFITFLYLFSKYLYQL